MHEAIPSVMVWKQAGLLNKVVYTQLIWCFASFVAEKKCEPNPCQNSGVCRELVEDEDYKCECLHGYRGKDCEGRLSQHCFS